VLFLRAPGQVFVAGFHRKNWKVPLLFIPDASEFRVTKEQAYASSNRGMVIVHRVIPRHCVSWKNEHHQKTGRLNNHGKTKKQID
jgi:hypothetical protein